MTSVHYLVVGGGLAGTLTALAVAEGGQGRVTLVERDGALGGNHTWSFHDGDLDKEGHRLIDGLVSHRWPSHRVLFPGYQRAFASGYSTIDSVTFGETARRRLLARDVDLRLETGVAELGPTHVRLEDGTVIQADVVIDARGPQRLPAGARGGYQKFVGLQVELGADGPWTVPLLMDATVAQEDGYRFIYVLPFSARRVLIEDTVYANGPRLDVEASERAILRYALDAGAGAVHAVRRETGVLPLPIDAEPALDDAGPLAVGYRGGLFHPVTGYSLPLAARAALAIAGARSAAEARHAVGELGRDLAGQQRFGRLLNRLTFEGLPPDARRGAFERFYRLPAPTIGRFYASRSTITDRARILLGRPPAGISWRGLLSARLHRPQGELS